MAEPSFDLGSLLDSLQGQDISSLLNTASAFLSQEPSDAPQTQPPHEEDTSDFSMPDPALLLKLTQLFALLNSKQSDPRTDLLNALRPLVTPERQQRIDTAARMLQLIRILPQLKELGL